MAKVRAETRLAQRGGAIELLRLPAALYAAITRLRGCLYDRGLLPRERLDVPVICVGNLTAGGTGKTPMVVYLVRELVRRGWKPGLLSRGYGAKRAGANDEARLLEQLLPGVPHEQDPNRAAAGRRLEALGVDCIVMDDGFQHRRLARELDLVLIDVTRPWGLPAPELGGAPVRAQLPRGLLRENPRGLKRAAACVLTRCDAVLPAEIEALRDELDEIAPGVPILESRHRPSGLRSLQQRATGGDTSKDANGSASKIALDQIRGQAFVLFSGIGNPQAFEATVRELGAQILEHRVFPDHHDFDAAQLRALTELNCPLLTTAKDAVRCPPDMPNLHVLDVELELTQGAPVLAGILDSLPQGDAGRLRSSMHEGLHG